MNQTKLIKLRFNTSWTNYNSLACEACQGARVNRFGLLASRCSPLSNQILYPLEMVHNYAEDPAEMENLTNQKLTLLGPGARPNNYQTRKLLGGKKKKINFSVLHLSWESSVKADVCLRNTVRLRPSGEQIGEEDHMICRTMIISPINKITALKTPYT